MFSKGLYLFHKSMTKRKVIRKGIESSCLVEMNTK